MDDGKLTKAEVRKLANLEKKIAGRMMCFMDVGRALLEIKEERLYLHYADTFEDYCKKRFGWTASYGGKVIRSMEASDDVSEVETAIGTIVPPNESVAREIAVLEADKDRQKLWRLSVDNYQECDGKSGAPTATYVRSIRKEHWPREDVEKPAVDRLVSLKNKIGTLADELSDLSVEFEELEGYDEKRWQRVLSALTELDEATGELVSDEP